MISSRHVALLATASLCLPPACGDDDDERSSGAEPATPAAFKVTVADAGRKSTVKAPRSVEAGVVEIALENTGKKPHDAQLISVDGDQTAKQVLAIIGDEGAPTPDWLHAAGGVGVVAGGETGTATDVLEPGKYFVFDTSGDGYAEFEVTGESGGELPRGPATVTAKEYGFETSGLKAGENTVTFDNVGEEPHHLIGVPIRKGATFAEVKKFATSDEEPAGPPPVDFENEVSTAALDGGKAQVTEVELKKGRYAFLCFIADRKGGPPHVVKGMLEEVEVE